MKGKYLMVLALGIGVSTFSLPLLAHHGNAAYDYTATKTVKGTVTDWTWANPHCFLWLDSKDENGNTTAQLSGVSDGLCSPTEKC